MLPPARAEVRSGVVALEGLKRTVLRLAPPPVRSALIGGWRWVKRRRLARETDGLQQMDIEAALIDAGISPGDTIMVHSSLSSLGKVEGGPETVLRALQAAVGPEGTLVLPTFSIPGSMQERLADPSYVFDPASTPSRMGAITEAFRHQPGVRRSHHPTHSIAVWGRHRDRLLDHEDLTYPTNFGPGTPMGRLAGLGAKVVGLGISMGPVTYYHCFEDQDLERFPGVYLPERVPARVLTAQGERATTILVHAPDYHAKRVDKDARIEASIRAHFDARDVRRTARLGKSGVWAVTCADFLRTLDDLQRQGVTIYTG